jgi:hypothetical protein
MLWVEGPGFSMHIEGVRDDTEGRRELVGGLRNWPNNSHDTESVSEQLSRLIFL